MLPLYHPPSGLQVPCCSLMQKPPCRGRRFGTSPMAGLTSLGLAHSLFSLGNWWKRRKMRKTMPVVPCGGCGNRVRWFAFSLTQVGLRLVLVPLSGDCMRSLNPPPHHSSSLRVFQDNSKGQGPDPIAPRGKLLWGIISLAQVRFGM